MNRIPEQLTFKIDTIKKRASFIEGKKDTYLKQVEKLSKEVEDLERDIDKLTKVSLVMGNLVEKMVKEDLKDIDALVNYGLKIVFPDRLLQFESSMTDVGSKKKVVWSTMDNGDKISEDAFGSVSVIESLLLRIISMIKKTKVRLLLLDETFGALDEDYVQNLGILLRGLSEQMKLDILLVTFNGLVSDANTVLRAKLNNITKELSISSVKERIDAKTL
jgi:DNA repair exonuclease SbcCD ATPase subunit